VGFPLVWRYDDSCLPIDYISASGTYSISAAIIPFGCPIFLHDIYVVLHRIYPFIFVYILYTSVEKVLQSAHYFAKVQLIPEIKKYLVKKI